MEPKKKKKFKCKPMVKVGAKEEAGSQQPHSESEPAGRLKRDSDPGYAERGLWVPQPAAWSRWETGSGGPGVGGAFSRLETPWSVAPLTPGHSGSPAPGGRGLGGDGLPGDGRLCLRIPEGAPCGPPSCLRGRRGPGPG